MYLLIRRLRNRGTLGDHAATLRDSWLSFVVGVALGSHVTFFDVYGLERRLEYTGDQVTTMTTARIEAKVGAIPIYGNSFCGPVD